MSNKMLDRICLICGDKANGFHFDVITCESCKSFFRRNFAKKQQYQCYLGGNCLIDKLNRSFCKSCRLEKCFAVGMKTELIYTEKQKQIRRSIIEENKRRRENMTVDNTSAGDSLSGHTSAHMTNTVSNNSIDFLDINSIDVNEEILKIECLIANNTNMSDISETLYQKTVEYESPVLPIQRPVTDYSNNFNEYEGKRIDELLDSIKCLQIPIISLRMASFVDTLWEGLRIFHFRCNEDIMKIVKMCKHLEAFRMMCESDQLTLLKYASIEIVLIRMILDYNFELEYWKLITDCNDSKLLTLELLRENQLNTYPNHKKFFTFMRTEWDFDSFVIDLLTAILLFNPNRPKLIHKDVVKLQQQIYLHLLQRYLQMKYRSECVYKSKYSGFLNNLNELVIMNEKIALRCLEYQKLYQGFSGPLMVEVCDRNESK